MSPTMPGLPAPRSVTHVTGQRGTRLHVPEWGTPDGPPILLIHGWSQAHPAWVKQLSGPLADRFRLIAPDLRGHGASDKPAGAEHYDRSGPWADDIAAIIATLDLHRPVLVGWSMGGWVAQDYLRIHGDTNIAGMVLVGTSVRTGTCLPPAVQEARAADPAVAARAMLGDDPAAEVQAITAFVDACSAEPLDPASRAAAIAYNALCPPAIRKASRGRSEDYRGTAARTTIPVLSLWGARERLCLDPMGPEIATAYPKGHTLTYDHSGHSPFLEEPARFNTDLASFADSAQGAMA
jgi:pimeloyl-ACP methyl ester carboxylesterase